LVTDTMEHVRSLYASFPCDGRLLPLDHVPLLADVINDVNLSWLVAGRHQCLLSDEDFVAAFAIANSDHMPKQWKPITREKFAGMQEWKQAKALLGLAYGQGGLPTAMMSTVPHGDREHEIEVVTDWVDALATSPPTPLDAQQVGDKEVWLVDGLFSEQECLTLIARTESIGYGGTNYPKNYRGNLRLITKDRRFTEEVWRRLQPLVPASMTIEGDDGVWNASGLNECWRLAKYHPGDVFKGHCDASFQRSAVEESMLTVNIYMNGGFEGGATRFYFGDRKEPDYQVAPAAGRCLLFRQPPGKAYYHDGEKLGSGVKYLFRTDVMYRKRD